MNIVGLPSDEKNEMGAFFSGFRSCHSRNHTSRNFSFKKLPKRRPSHCSRDPCILYFVLNCSFCEKVDSEFVSDTDKLNTACMNEG